MHQLTTLISLVGLASSHSNLYDPAIRGNKQWWGYCSPAEGCPGPCEAPYSDEIYRYRKRPVLKRNGVLPVKWFRQNHPGGFVRLSIVPTKDSASHEAFDNNVFKYRCYESGCRQDDQPCGINDIHCIYNMKIGFHGYQAGPNHPHASKTNDCSTDLKIPPHLPDGDYTLQWLWFGGGVNLGDKFAAFENYYSCADIRIKGGNSGPRPAPIFEGGDAVVTTRKDQCRFWGRADTKTCAHGSFLSRQKNPHCYHSGPRVGAPAEFLALRDPKYRNATYTDVNDRNGSEFIPPRR